MTREEFLLSYPEFARLRASIITSTITLAEISCPVAKWGTMQPIAVGLFTAHTLSARYNQLSVTASTAGAIAAGNQVSFPSVPTSGGSGAEDDAFLGTTTYGVRLKQYKDQLGELAKLGMLGDEAKGYQESVSANTGFAF